MYSMHDFRYGYKITKYPQNLKQMQLKRKNLFNLRGYNNKAKIYLITIYLKAFCQDKLQQTSICISEPQDSPINDFVLTNEQSSISSPPININISPVSPPTSPKENFEDENNQQKPEEQESNGNEEEKQNLLPFNNTIQNVPATINEEHEDSTKNKSSLSLPHESTQIPSIPSSINTNNHVNSNGNPISNHLPLTNTASMPKPSLCERSQSDRRKLSVSNLMSFGEQRRRSTSSIFSDMRKMSITNFDSLKSPGIGEIESYL